MRSGLLILLLGILLGSSLHITVGFWEDNLTIDRIMSLLRLSTLESRYLPHSSCLTINPEDLLDWDNFTSTFTEMFALNDEYADIFKHRILKYRSLYILIWY